MLPNVNPYAARVGVLRNWYSRYYYPKYSTNFGVTMQCEKIKEL